LDDEHDMVVEHEYAWLNTMVLMLECLDVLSRSALKYLYL